MWCLSWKGPCFKETRLNTPEPRPNGLHSEDGIFTSIFERILLCCEANYIEIYSQGFNCNIAALVKKKWLGTEQVNSLSEPTMGWLTHWGRVTHICVSKSIIIGSDNGLSPDRRQAIIWPNAGILLIRTLGTNLSEILIEINTFPFKKMHLKMLPGKWRPFCLGLINWRICSTRPHWRFNSQICRSYIG